MIDDPKTSLKPTPSTEFSPDHWTSLHLSDTISVPSASHAPGRLFYGVRFHPAGGPSAEPQFFFKLTQVIHDREIITRTFDDKCVKAIRYRPMSCKEDPSAPGWILKTIHQLETDNEIVNWRKALKKATDATKTSHEMLLFEHAVIFVPGTASVLLRRDHGLTAMEAEECLFIGGGGGGNC